MVPLDRMPSPDKLAIPLLLPLREATQVLSSNSDRSSHSGAPTFATSTPIDMALNHGTYCSDASLAVLQHFKTNTSLRHFPAADNGELRAALAAQDGLQAENVLVANGSGPLLKLCLPYLIERQIKSEVPRILRHLVFRSGFPIYTPRLTYSKVPAAAAKIKLTYEMLPLGPENNFTLSMDDLARRLEKREGLVYIANPNNPTGNVLVTRDQLKPLLNRFMNSIFVIDEAYVEYISRQDHAYFGSMVKDHPNLLVLRSFSFAWGLGAARLGYALGNKGMISEFEAKLTPHQVNTLTSEMAIAALKDSSHLEYVRNQTASQREVLMKGLRKFQGVEAYDSLTNFILCRLSPGRTGKQVYEELLRRKIKVKIFEALKDEKYDEYFRITIGLPEENEYLLSQLAEILNG
ncbi:MAG: pyridoxal phosphate-dependent aminotransferase [Myxococcota bacterium]